MTRFSPGETLDSLQDLGVILRRIHGRMVAEGYAIVDGQVIKLNAQQNHEHARSDGEGITKGHIER